jgi:Fic family protein
MLTKPEAKLRRQNRIKTIQASLAIEGNTLDIEGITSIINNKRVIGPQKDIIEVKNAIKTYEKLHSLKSDSQNDFKSSHKILMRELINSPGKYRNSQIGIQKGEHITHIAPGPDMVPGLMNELFQYLKKNEDPKIIKSCVFHYELEFIHPFQDGNGRMGRLWQTRILMDENEIFEYVPIEQLIKENQQEYYNALSESDNTGKSTLFIEFMLEKINTALRQTIADSKPLNPDFQTRSTTALKQLTGWFDRKEYMSVCKGISSATASRDLKQLLEQNKIESNGTGRMTKYRKI